MRVWLVEMTPDYEQSTRVGIFYAPLAAWDALYEQVNHHVLHADKVEVSLGADSASDGLKADITLEIKVGVNDVLSLTGVYVEGTSNQAPTPGEWSGVRHVGTHLVRVLMNEGGFIGNTEETDGRSHRWTFRQP